MVCHPIYTIWFKIELA